MTEVGDAGDSAYCIPTAASDHRPGGLGFAKWGVCTYRSGTTNECLL